MPKRELTEIELQNNQLKRKTNAFLNSVREFLKKKTGGDSVPPEWECSLMLLEEYYKQFTKLSMEIEKLDRLVVQSRYGEVPNPLLAARDKSAVRLESLMKNLGITFKENCPDIRNSKVEDIIKRFAEYEIVPVVVDPWANSEDAMREYGVVLTKLEDVKDADCVIVAVAHNEFKMLNLDQIKTLFKKCDDSEKVLIDVKGMFPIGELRNTGMKYWRL